MAIEFTQKPTDDSEKIEALSQLDLVRFGKVAPLVLRNEDLDFFESTFMGRYFQSYYLDVAASGGFPDVFFKNPNITAYYFYYTDFRTGTFPEIPAGCPARSIYFDYSYEMGSDDPFPLPDSWSNLGYTNRLFFRRCGLTTSQVDSLVTQIEALVNAGMSRDASNLYVYANLAGTGSNGPLTTALHVANGWTLASGRIEKTINGKTVRIYHL